MPHSKSSPKYLPTIGLEIHAELKTASKMFCACKNNPDEEKPNTNVCPICLGHPGTLPVLNMEAIRHVLKMGVAVNGTIADFTEWDRKNYFYPDIPKGYQISQYKYPLVTDGELSGVTLERIHLEEDTAQSTHDAKIERDQRGSTSLTSLNLARWNLAEVSLLNFNRAGVPLMELVTKPVIHDAATAVRFAKELQLLLRYLGASEANMEKGEMRVEANISVAPRKIPHLASLGTPFPRGTSATESPFEKGGARRAGDLIILGTKTEVKNLNSFRSVEKAIEYEIARQTSLLEAGQKVIQETRGWDDKNNETYSQRSKESSHDYRYFPDPDIPKLKLSEIAEFSRETLATKLPELPWVKRDRFKKDFNMTDKEVAVFVESPELASYFESIISSFRDDPKKIKLTTNYVLTDYIKLVKDAEMEYSDQTPRSSDLKSNTKDSSPHTSYLNTILPASFAELITIIATGEINSRAAKDILALMFKEKGSSAKALASKHDLIQKSDASDLVPIIEKVLADNPQVVTEYKAGKVASLQFLIGQTMKATKGAGNPEMVKKLLLQKLG